VTCYYGWVGGTVYADYNELRLAWTLSEVAHAHIEGEPIPPTIQQSSRATSSSTSRIWRGYEEAVEKAEIRDRLIQEVAESPSNRLPKNRLADRVIRRDKDRIGGVGYDPRLVAEAYDAVVPYALVEEHVDVETPTEGRSPCRSSDSDRARHARGDRDGRAVLVAVPARLLAGLRPAGGRPARPPRRRCPTERRQPADRGFSHSYR